MMGAIYMLWLRQLKRYVRSRARMIGALGQPLLFLLALWFGFGPIYAKAGGGNYLEFLVPGIVSMAIMFTAMFMGIEVIWDRQFGFLKETMVAPVSRAEIFVGRTLGGATVALAQGIIVLIISISIGFTFNWTLLPVALVVMFLIGFMFTAFGTALASMIEDMNAFPVIMNFIMMPIFFLSGALFPLSGLPKGIGFVAQLNPLSYGVDGLRSALTSTSHFGLGVSFLVLFISIGIIFGMGVYLFNRIQI